MDGYFNIGDMDTLITVQSVTQTIGDRGQKKVAVTKYADVYAKLDRRTNICRVHHEKRWTGRNTSWNQECREKYQ